MKKKVFKVAAMVALTAVIVTGIPIDNVYAGSASFIVSAGGALATGNGSSLHDIRANLARNKAKQTTVKNQNSTGKEGAEASNEQDFGNKHEEFRAVTEENTITGAVPELADENTIEKVQTPSSKAVDEDEVIDGVTVVGSASEAAQIEITSTNDGKDGANDSKDGDTKSAEDSENASETDTEDKSAEPLNPSIAIKPDVEEDGEEGLSDKVIADCDGYVYVREFPDSDSEYVGKLYNHSAGIWLDKEGDWVKIESGSVVGYVKSDYVKTGKAAVELANEVGIRMAKVNTTTLKIRSDASLDASVLGLVPMDDDLTVVEEAEEWVKVNIEEGDGWVSKEFVELSTYFPPAESVAEEKARLAEEEAARKKANAAAQKATKGASIPSGGGHYSVAGSGMGANVANYALQFVGNPYVYGGTSLTNGTDCSGFTMGVYNHFGVGLPHSSGAQRSCGYGVASIAEALPGDIICYSGHVGIYIGGGQIVHASTAATGIKVSTVGYRSILAIRRIF